MNCIKKYMTNKGYTLIELTIGIIIISIISRIVVFSVTQIERSNLSNDGLILKNVIEEMQTSAIFTNRRHGINFINDKEYYSYIIDNRGEIIQLEQYSLSKENIILFSNLQESGINFTVRGTITKGGTIELVSKNFKLELSIEIGSGNVNMYGVDNR